MCSQSQSVIRMLNFSLYQANHQRYRLIHIHKIHMRHKNNYITSACTQKKSSFCQFFFFCSSTVVSQNYSQGANQTQHFLFLNSSQQISNINTLFLCVSYITFLLTASRKFSNEHKCSENPLIQISLSEKWQKPKSDAPQMAHKSLQTLP